MKQAKHTTGATLLDGMLRGLTDGCQAAIPAGRTAGSSLPRAVTKAKQHHPLCPRHQPHSSKPPKPYNHTDAVSAREVSILSARQGVRETKGEDDYRQTIPSRC